MLVNIYQIIHYIHILSRDKIVEVKLQLLIQLLLDLLNSRD